MTDIALILTQNGFDIGLDGADLLTESGLRNAVLISLLTDRRADNDDIIPDGSDDMRGCWMDMFEDHIKGSRLWLLTRELQTSEVMRRAKEYAEEALEWMLDTDVALSVAVDVAWSSQQNFMLALRARIELPDGSVFSDSFDYPLRAA